jgi:hypothetical protein
MSDARIEIRPPRLFTTPAIAAITAYGLIVSVPVLAAMLVISVRGFSITTFLVPLGALAIASFFLPFGFGNPLVVRRVQGLKPVAIQTANAFVVQLAFNPRLREGWRALLEDADDFGWLELSDSALNFYGDSVTLSLPYAAVARVRLRTSGWRGLFAYGARITLETQGLQSISSIQFAERSSWILPVSRTNANRIYEALKLKVPQSTAQPGERVR